MRSTRVFCRRVFLLGMASILGSSSESGSAFAPPSSAAMRNFGAPIAAFSSPGIGDGSDCRKLCARESRAASSAFAGGGYWLKAWRSVGQIPDVSRRDESVSAESRHVVSNPLLVAPWPDATNTGVPEGVILTVVDGDLTIRAAGAVIDGKDIRGCVVVTAPGVVIRRSKIRCTFGYAVLSSGYAGTGLLIEDSEIECRDSNGVGTRATAVGDNNFTARRLNIHNCENGFDVDVNVTIQDSWIHDLYDDEEAHPDGIQIAIGRNVLIEHNSIFARGTSAIISHPTTMSGVTIRNNLLAGGAYALYCPRDRSSDVRVIDNRFSRIVHPKGGVYGPWTDCGKVAELRGNVWDDTGKLLPGQPIP